MDLWMFIALGALAMLALAGFFAGVFWFEFSKRRQFNLRLEEVARSLNGLCVEGKNAWTHPLIVIDEAGMRTRISLEASAVGDGTGTSMLQVKKLSLTTDGYDPNFKFSIAREKGFGWFADRRIKTGKEEFDSKFAVSSNRFENSINSIISPEIMRRILAIGVFEPVKPLSGKVDGESKEKFANADSMLKRKRRKLPLISANLHAMTKQVNKHRFSCYFDKGIGKFQLLIQESEMDLLEDFIYTMIDIQRELTTNVATLERASIKKPLEAAKPT